jgi:N-acetylneuraminic acid mutarotase
MKKKSTDRAAFLSPRTLVILVVCAGACSIAAGTLLAFLRGEAVLKDTPRTLTFAERVAYQRIIEDVYWRHRIWPKERPDAKPSLDAVMSQGQLEKKVTDYLRKSHALEEHWHRPITAEQLQAEMDRMAKHTKQREVLQELFEALGNDPFIIAECLARPSLADRLLTNWYAFDQRIHGELRQRAEAELLAHPSAEQMKRLSGKYNEVVFEKSDTSTQRRNRGAGQTVILNTNKWDDTVENLAATFNKSHGAAILSFAAQRHIAAFGSANILAHSKTSAAEAYDHISVGRLSFLQEDESRYYATAAVSKGNDHLKVATVSWQKEPLQSWLARAENQAPEEIASLNTNYALPILVADGCIEDTWTATAGPPEGGEDGVWTGSEMIIWGGGDLNRGARYNPSTDTWAATNTTNAPTGRSYFTAVWTGTEMIVWGGVQDDPFNVFNTGGRYNPNTDSWTATSTTNAPDPRYIHTAVWTGSEMIIWGGTGADVFNTGGRYNPNTDSWTPTSTTNAPAGRYAPTAVWTGNEMIVWGGTDDLTAFGTGGRYNPSTNTWIATTTTNAPEGRLAHTAVWTGNEMIIWGGTDIDNKQDFNTGARYDPGADSWTATSISNAPAGRAGHTAVWSGVEMIVWGGGSNTGGRYNPATNSWTATTTTNAPAGGYIAVWTGKEMLVWGGDSGGRYDPSTNSWTAINTYNAPEARGSHTAVWTGSEMIVWGGHDDITYLNTGGRYDAATDSWTATTTTNAPASRSAHTAVWTGSEMVVWGGVLYDAGYHYLNTGGRYNPSADTWLPTSITSVPSARAYHTAVWSGTQMIVWGGTDDFNDFNSGGRYNPGTNSWTVTSTANAPAGRAGHTAVWTGSEMITWGGYDFNNAFSTGGRYNPGTNSWIPTTTANAPAARWNHTGVWTGTEMIVWGGQAETFVSLNTGGRYNPSLDIWTATSTTDAPDAREFHTAVWTGGEVVIWGGAYQDFSTIVLLDTGGRYNPGTDNWTPTSTNNAPRPRYTHTTVWTGNEMIVWGGQGVGNTGGRYCAQSGPPPSPTPTATASPSATATPTITPTATPTTTPVPCTGRCSPTPRPRPAFTPRPTPPPHITPVPTPSSPRPTPAPRP